MLCILEVTKLSQRKAEVIVLEVTKLSQRKSEVILGGGLFQRSAVGEPFEAVTKRGSSNWRVDDSS
jgi:hypothetical protein